MATDDVYVAWSLATDAAVRDLLAAELSSVGFEGFEETSDALIAMIPEVLVTDTLRSVVETLAGRYGVGSVATRRIEPRNWNAQWEETVRPIEAGGFVVHPPWHVPPDGKRAIRIEPKMSFGTGHHATTRLMLTLLESIVRPGDRVLDVGTGTGVLAIAALLLGAAECVACDTDPWAVRNARENAASNRVDDRLRIVEGGVRAVPDGPVDVILANINRSILMELMPTFRDRLRPGGRLALSGVTVADRPAMRGALDRVGLRFVDEASEEDWWAGTAEAR